MPNKNLNSLGRASSIICKEVFDDGYQPSTEEIIEYAAHIGINPKTEPHLLYIAKEGLLHAIPSEWQICYNDDCGGYYYYNTLTKVRQWEHPLDAEYKQKVESVRKSCAAGNDFSEDTSQIDSGIKSLQGDDSDLLTDPSPVSSIAIRKMDLPSPGAGRFLTPLDKRPSPLSLAPIESVRNKRFEITNNFSNNPLPSTQIGLSMHQESPSKPLEMLPPTPPFKGFTLSGKGSMFLKSSAKKADAAEDPDAKLKLNDGEKNVRSILRDSSSTDLKKKPELKTSELESEDRKSVRFNLTKITATNQDMFGALAKSDESSNEEENIEWEIDNEEDDGAKGRNKILNKFTENSASGLINMFEKRNIETGQIKPLYEDTDSESVTSIRSANNIRQIDNGFTQTHDSNPFRRQSNIDLNTNENVPHLFNRKLNETNFDLTDERNKLQQDLEKKKKTLEIEFEMELKKFTKELEEKTNDRKIELESQHNVEVEKFKQQLTIEWEERRKALKQEHRIAEEKLQEDHKIILHELERDLKTEADLIRKDHATNLQQMREQMKHDLEMEKQRMRETGENHLYEKIRCEKRLLEDKLNENSDKYRCLKAKYGRLKADVKLSLERRNQRREQQSITTGSETERTNSNKQSNEMNLIKSTDKRKPAWAMAPKKIDTDRMNAMDKVIKHSIGHGGATAKYQKPCTDDTSISQSDTTISNNYQHNSRILLPNKTQFTDNGNSDSEAFQHEHNNNYRDTHERQRKKTFTRMKSASTSRLNTNSNLKANGECRPCTPVESLRRQLQKLDDLEDQFPDNSLDTTYHLRYPFNVESNRDRGTSSTELEFFKHRIHLERDSVRRAKESLRVQRNNFRSRQREIKHHHRTANRHNIDQMIQEEKELTEMEVNLHRTRALLGEKVIRLKHLEQSLQRLLNEKSNLNQFNADKDDTTISDLSSHSSSGFSSTDFASDTQGQRKESDEIVQTLESLNNEIREIWNILSQQQTQGLTPPPTILYSDWRNNLPIATMFPNTDGLDEQKNATSTNSMLCQPLPSLIDRLETYRHLASCRLTTGATDIANNLKIMPTEHHLQQSMQNCTINLMERTQDLRDWLKKAKNEHQLLKSGQQTDI